MTTETVVKKPSLTESNLAAAQRLYEQMSIDTKTGIAEDPAKVNAVIEEILYSNGVTKELATQYEANIETAIVAGTAAFRARSQEAYAANPELLTTEVVFNMHHKNKLSFDTLRSKQYPNPQDKENPITKEVVINYDYETTYDKNIGQLKIARSTIFELGAASLA